MAASSGRRAKPNSVETQSVTSSPIRERWPNENRARVEVIEREVAVGDGVERVGRHRARRRRDAQCRPCECRRTERRPVGGLGRKAETSSIAVEHFDPGEEVMADTDGLSPLRGACSRGRRLRVLLGPLDQDPRQPFDPLDRLTTRVGDVERSAAATWSFRERPACSFRPASPRLCSIKVWTSLEPGLVLEAPEHAFGLGELVGVQEVGRVEPASVDERRLAVVRQQVGVVRREGSSQLRAPARPDAPRPERHVVTGLARAEPRARSRAGARRMKPSAASCGNVSPVPYDASSCEYSACSDRRPVTTAEPACSETRTSPVTRDCVAAKNAS